MNQSNPSMKIVATTTTTTATTTATTTTAAVAATAVAAAVAGAGAAGAGAAFYKIIQNTVPQHVTACNDDIVVVQYQRT